MHTLFIEYPTCSTCRKAKKFLQSQDILFIDRHIVNETPTVEELKSWCEKGNVHPRSLFNTSGQVYRQMQLIDSIASLQESDLYALLAGNGMLIKRPLLIYKDTLLYGFKEDEWKQVLMKK